MKGNVNKITILDLCKYFENILGIKKVEKLNSEWMFQIQNSLRGYCLQRSKGYQKSYINFGGCYSNKCAPLAWKPSCIMLNWWKCCNVFTFSRLGIVRHGPGRRRPGGAALGGDGLLGDGAGLGGGVHVATALLWSSASWWRRRSTWRRCQRRAWVAGSWCHSSSRWRSPRRRSLVLGAGGPLVVAGGCRDLALIGGGSSGPVV